MADGTKPPAAPGRDDAPRELELVRLEPRAIVERELEVGASRSAVTRDHDEALRCAATGRVALAGAPGPRAPAP